MEPSAASEEPTESLLESNGSPTVSSVADGTSLADVILQIYNDLLNMIEVSFGLLDDLSNDNVLSAKEVENIETQSTFEARVTQLLDYILDKSSEKREQFLAALNTNQQSHVVNYIQAIKDKRSGAKHEWPLWTSRTATKIRRNMLRLKEIIDCRCGLLDHMLSEKCINSQQKLFVEAGETDEEANGRLLSLLLRQSVRVYHKFIDILVNTNQHTVASLLAPEQVGNIPPISDKQRFRLIQNWKMLEELIGANKKFEYLIAHLDSVSFLTLHQRKFVESAASRTACSTRLLKILRRGSASDFTKFVQCLYKTKQQHIGRILSEDGVVALIVAKTNSSFNVSKGIMKLLRRQHCGERVNQILEQLRKEMCEMICAHGQECLRLFFFCCSLTGLHHLRELFASGRLEAIVNDIIGTLSSDSLTEPWKVGPLEWDENADEDADRSSNMSQINNEPFQSDTENQHSNCDDITESKSVYAFNVEDRIAKFRDQLLEIIDIEYDLLDELLNLRLLTSRQVDFIRGGRTSYDQIDELLKSVIKMPKHQQERFLEALTKTRQSHVKDYIVADGVYSAERASNWPLAASQEFLKLHDNRAKFLDLTDTKCGLLELLYSGRCIGIQQKQRLEACKDESDRNRKLHAILCRKSVGDFNTFIDCLRKTNQHHILSFLASDEVESPLSEKTLDRLVTNHNRLVETIDLKPYLWAKLYSKKFLTEYQMARIESANSPLDSVSRLLDIVRRGREKDVKEFVDCLVETGQMHVASLLQNTEEPSQLA